MTPAAAQLFQITDNQATKAILARAQFFECSALTAMAHEMVVADVDQGCHEYSLTAQLPAPLSVFEYMNNGVRCMLIVQQVGNHLMWDMFIREAGDVTWIAESGFHLGTGNNDDCHWNAEYLLEACRVTGRGRLEFSETNTKATNGQLEKILCIINQPQLVERQERKTQKRVVRSAAKDGAGTTVPAVWHECRVRPGSHGKPYAEGTGSPRQLHYVRKHWKPSVAKWVDGYWRGNADLGTYLKWYETRALARGRAA
jgi:hypothetical protein